MPKIKTNRLAAKKLRVSKSGTIKRGHACKSHNTAKKTSKRKMRLRARTTLNSANKRAVKQMLPYS